MATLTVGAGQQYQTIASAVAASKDGDVLMVQAGTYVNDYANITTNITLQGVGGMVKMVSTGDIPNGKGILVVNSDVTIDHFEFSGATSSSGNAAGIRYQDGDLVITNSYFHNNQNGILGNPMPGGTISIDNSEFAFNGTGDGYTHNLYVGDIAKLTVTDSYFHDAAVGHQIKSRAEVTEISNNRIFDNGSNSSYSIDLPNGGKAIITGNIIQQGVNAGNPNIVAFGAEGNLHSGSTVSMINNTVINDLGKGTMLFNASNSQATVTGNNVWGLSDSQIVSGSGASVSGTTHLSYEPSLDVSKPYLETGSSPTPSPTPEPTTGVVWTGTAGADAKTGGSGADSLSGMDGADSLSGGGGSDTLDGGAGNDQVNGDGGNDQVYGGDGADTVYGGAGDDFINGNKGDDLVDGGEGRDYVYGGQGSDRVEGAGGDDFYVQGNMGDDTVHGGAGSDIVLGGQGSDFVYGDAGNDTISGDLGDDVLSGGAGADLFLFGANSGLDVIKDFNGGEGDRIQLSAGQSYNLISGSGQLTVDLGNGSSIVLEGISKADFNSGWIVNA